MDLIGAAGKIISLIEAGITISDELKDIARSEHKLPSDLVNLYNNAQQLLETLETLPSTGSGSVNDAKIGLLADRAKNISNKVIGIMDEINPKWRQKQETSLALWRSYLKKKDMHSIEKDFEVLREHMKIALLDLVCQSSSEARSQYEELRRRVRLGDERVISIQGSVHEFSQQLHAVQDSIYNLGKQIGSDSLAKADFCRQASEVLTFEWKLSTILSRLIQGFQEKDLKANAIAESDPGTFDWMTQGSNYHHNYPDNLIGKERLAYNDCDPDMFKHREEASINFRSFIQGPSGSFMILGKPGSGKSTLMKCLMHNPLVLQNLEQWAAKSNKKLIRAIFFFSVTQGSGTLSSEESLYRSLLFQIIRECPTLVDEILPGESNLPVSIPLSLGAVQGAIRCLFLNKSKVADKYCFCLFIDGLDEFRSNFSDPKRGKTQNNYEISELAHSLMEWCQDEASYIKMIFSSRVIPALDNRFPAKAKILLHIHTKRDILQSALSNFKRHPEANPEDYVELSKVICDQAQGVFLWARLVIKDILEASTDGVDPSTFRERIEETPTDITDLYAKILDRVKEQDREASAVMLRLAAFQPTGFRLNTLACVWLDKLKDVGFPGNEPAKVCNVDEINQQRKRAIQRLAALTHGLLEAQNTADMTQGPGIPDETKTFFQSEIVFLHRTAQDFIRSLLIRDGKDANQGILPWLQGNDNVSADDWSQSWRTNLFVRVFHAEMRFGIPRWEDDGESREGLWDFGFWDDGLEQLQLPDFGTLSDFSQFSRRYKILYLGTETKIYYKSEGTRGAIWRGEWPRRISLERAVDVGEDLSSVLQKRHLSPKLISRIALSYAILSADSNTPLDGLEWLLRNNKICATDRRLTWYRDGDGSLIWHSECSSGGSKGSFVHGDPAPSQIWLFILHALGLRARIAATSSDEAELQKSFESQCQILELWLRYGAATDAVVLITFAKVDYAYKVKAEEIFYVEIEQLLQLGEKPLNIENLQQLLAERHYSSWVSWISNWLSWLRFSKKTIPIRSRYSCASTQELCQLN